MLWGFGTLSPKTLTPKYISLTALIYSIDPPAFLGGFVHQTGMEAIMTIAEEYAAMEATEYCTIGHERMDRENEEVWGEVYYSFEDGSILAYMSARTFKNKEEFEAAMCYYGNNWKECRCPEGFTTPTKMTALCGSEGRE